MRVWKLASFAATAIGLGALILVLLARWGVVRIDGFGVFYSLTAQELSGISVLFLLAFVLYLTDRVTAVESSIPEAPNADKDSSGGPSSDEAIDQAQVPIQVLPPPGTETRAGDAGTLVHISRLTKIYRLGPVEVHALREANLDILSGSVTVILGPSGSGKTTLLNLLGGIDRATSGSILFNGEDVSKLDDSQIVEYRRERVGFVFQFFNLIPSLTARENVALAAELVPHAIEVEKVLRMVGLGERMDHFPAELSGGEQQRVAIARALVKNPPLLLCDEPTGELDYATGIRILDILRNVAHSEGRAVIVVTHNASLAEMADQVVRLRGGRVDEVVRNPDPVPPSMLRW